MIELDRDLASLVMPAWPHWFLEAPDNSEPILISSPIAFRNNRDPIPLRGRADYFTYYMGINAVVF